MKREEGEQGCANKRKGERERERERERKRGRGKVPLNIEPIP